MTPEVLMSYALAMAKDMLRARRAEAAGADLFFWDVGGSENAQKSIFRRQGSSTLRKSYDLPGDLASLIRSNFTTAAVPSDLSLSDSSFLRQLLDRNTSAVPGQSVLEDIKAINPAVFSGSSSLSNIMARNPYSTDYEQATRALYERQFDKARSMAVSGPTNVRGAQDRMGIELAELDTNMANNRFKEIREAQNAEAGVVENAVQIHNMIESMRRGTQMQAQGQEMAGVDMLSKLGLGASGALNSRRAASSATLGMAAEYLGSPTQTSSENTSGRGIQTASGDRWGTSFNCCWTFMEAYDGKMPDFVRKGRDLFVTNERREGYRIMSNFVVPKMRVSSMWRRLVKTALIKPFEALGRQHFVTGYNKSALVLRPYCWTWIYAWQLLGKLKGK